MLMCSCQVQEKVFTNPDTDQYHRALTCNCNTVGIIVDFGVSIGLHPLVQTVVYNYNSVADFVTY